MRKTDQDLVDALDSYLEARSKLEEIRKKVKPESLSQDTISRLASKVATVYECHWYFTNEGGVTFCDDVQKAKETRRDDARKFWRRMILGMRQ